MLTNLASYYSPQSTNVVEEEEDDITLRKGLDCHFEVVISLERIKLLKSHPRKDDRLLLCLISEQIAEQITEDSYKVVACVPKNIPKCKISRISTRLSAEQHNLWRVSISSDQENWIITFNRNYGLGAALD